MLPLLLSALALAPPLAEAPQTIVPGRTYGGCPEVTGAPGEIALEWRDGVRFLQATREGFKVTGELGVPGCPAVSARANGAGVLAVPWSGEDFQDGVAAAVREPGGTWGAPTPFVSDDEWDVDDIQTAVADSGDAVVAWVERRFDTRRLRVARRAPGQAFGPAETIGRELGDEVLLQAGVASTGETVVMTATVESTRLPLRVPVRIAIAPRGAPVPPLTGLGLVPWRSLPSLAVAQDGRALVALPDGASVRVAEREPGQGFGAPVPVGAATDAAAVRTDVTLGADGAAAVAWTGEEEEAAAIVTRRAAGAFTPPVAVRRRTPFTGDPFWISQTALWRLDLASAFGGVRQERLTLTGDGRAALSGFRDHDDTRGVYRPLVSLTTVPLGGDRAETQGFGAALGLPLGPAALALADGSPALFWVERIDDTGSLHLAAPGATTPAEPAPPAVRVGAPVDRVVRPYEPLVLPVRCSGPCDVRAQALGGSGATGRLRLARAGRGRLEIETGRIPLAPRRLGPVRIRLTYGRRFAQRPSTRIITVRLERPADPPAPRVVGLRAERREDTIRVSWRVRHPAELAAYLVTGAATREWSGEPPAFAGTYTTNGRGSFAVTLSPAGDVRWVTVRGAADRSRTVIPVR